MVKQRKDYIDYAQKLNNFGSMHHPDDKKSCIFNACEAVPLVTQLHVETASRTLV